MQSSQAELGKFAQLTSSFSHALTNGHLLPFLFCDLSRWMVLFIGYVAELEVTRLGIQIIPHEHTGCI